jgi:GNAT superfamily N-acetyltransferase
MTLRPFRQSDLAPVLALLSATMPHEGIAEPKFTRQVLLDPNFRPEGAIVAEHAGSVVGFCLSLARQTPLENAPSDADRGYVTLFGVLPAHRRQGIGSALLKEAEAYLRAQNRKLVMISSYAPGYFIPGVDVAAYEPALPFLAKNGYKEVYRPLAMECPLWPPFSVPQWVEEKRKQRESEGFRFTPYTPALTLPLLDFTRKEFPGDWVRVVRTAADRILQGDNPSRLVIAHRDGTVYGFSHFDNERFGPIGTAQASRGQGLGQILMYQTLQAQRSANFRAAWFLWSDDKTAARIYSAAGFKETRRFALMRKEL